MVYTGIFYGGQLLFTNHHAIGASGETSDNEIIDKQSAYKLLAALKSNYP